MKKIFFIVSLDFTGGGADNITDNNQDVEKAVVEFESYLKNNHLAGTISVYRDSTTLDNWIYIKENPGVYFDNVDLTNLEVISTRQIS